jgi:hypothetical protein
LKAARNGGFSFISNGFRPLRVFTEIIEITVFSEKCCQNVVTKQACKKQENPSPSVCRERGDVAYGRKIFQQEFKSAISHA